MIISSVQFKPDFVRSKDDVKKNIDRCRSLVEKAGSFGSEIVVLPELCVTGYSFMSPEEVSKIAENIGEDDITLKFIKDAASDLQAYIAFGFPERNGNKLYNSSAIVDPYGNIISHYRKMNLWGNDYLWATPGDSRPIVAETELGSISTIVCRDIKDSTPGSKNRPMFDQEVDIVAACVNWGSGGFPATTWMDFASDNKCILIVANRWGREENNGFLADFGQGGSVVVDKNWKCHTNGLKFNSDCIVTVNV